MAASPTIVCFPFAGRELGGSHISVLGLIRHLDRERYQPRVVVQYMDSPIAKLFQDNGIAVGPAPETGDMQHGERAGIGHLVHACASIRPLVRFVRASGARIVHTNDGRTHAMWALPARLAGAKLLWHHRGDPRAAGLRFVAPFLANRVVSVSQFAAPRPGLISAASKTRVVHSPFDINVSEDRQAARAALIAELGVPQNTRIVGFFGVLIPRKRPLLFVDAIAALRRRYPEIPIVGLLFGECLEDAENTVPARAKALGIASEVKLMGFRYPGARWLAACDILMVPAINEPFGRTLIEAMLLGTPVVATESGGNPEALRDGETGLLVPPENADALADATAALLSDSKRWHAIADHAHADALGRYGEERHAAAIMDLYDEILAELHNSSARAHSDAAAIGAAQRTNSA